LGLKILRRHITTLARPKEKRQAMATANAPDLQLSMIPDSAVGRRLRWFLMMLLSRGQNSTADDHANYTRDLARRLGVKNTGEAERDRWRVLASGVGDLADLTINSASDFEIDGLMRCTKERDWRFALAVEDRVPHRISKIEWERQIGHRIEAREATATDAAVLSEIERQSPMVRGELIQYFDRGDDYFAFARLMEDVTVGIVFADGEPAGAGWAATRVVRIGGVVHPIQTFLHIRVVPKHQRKGIRRAIASVIGRNWSKVHGSCVYMSPENETMEHTFGNRPNRWSVLPLNVQISCAQRAGPSIGRPATRADAGAIVRILNECHGREEMYLPYTLESFSARVERAPKQYGWGNLWLSDRAVVGVLAPGDAFTVVEQRKDTRSQQKWGLAMDYGFLPGAEEELAGLLRAWCGRLAPDGVMYLSIFTSPSSPGAALLKSFAQHVDSYILFTPGIAEPPGAAERGLYVDQMYFF
ncbi:MAG: hypothetical protein ACREQF_06500, partial [Candidatus Binataceae bacterium]